MDLITLGLDPPPKKTRNEVFLEEMNQIALIQSDARWHQAVGGRPPLAIATMQRIHSLQWWWHLSDPAKEEELHDRPLYRRFIRLDGTTRLTMLLALGNLWMASRQFMGAQG